MKYVMSELVGRGIGLGTDEVLMEVEDEVKSEPKACASRAQRACHYSILVHMHVLELVMLVMLVYISAKSCLMYLLGWNRERDGRAEEA